jgi:hypothetical protein
MDSGSEREKEREIEGETVSLRPYGLIYHGLLGIFLQSMVCMVHFLQVAKLRVKEPDTDLYGVPTSKLCNVSPSSKEDYKSETKVNGQHNPQTGRGNS